MEFEPDLAKRVAMMQEDTRSTETPEVDPVARLERELDRLTTDDLQDRFVQIVEATSPQPADLEKLEATTREAQRYFEGVIHPDGRDHWRGFFYHAVFQGTQRVQSSVGLTPGSFGRMLESYIITHRPYQRQL